MRGARIVIVALAVCLGTAGPVRAGIYSTAEPLLWPVPADNFQQFLLTLGDLRGALVQDQNQLRKHYQERAASLEKKERAGTLTAEDRLNLSAYYLRLGKPEDAARILDAIPAKQRNFMILANLATAHFLAGRLDRAISFQQQALKAWPPMVAEWVGYQPEWYGGPRDWYARAEKYFLKLLQLRYQESVRQPGKPWTTVDALFPGVRFVGRSGEYEPGELATDQRMELPPDAIRLVVQLILWLPADDRLYWLLGELANARGDLEPAEKIFQELVYARGNTRVRELMEHRKAIMQAKQSMDTLNKERGKLLFMLAPRGILQPPVVGAMAYESGWVAFDYCWSRKPDDLLPQDASSVISPVATPAPIPDAALPNWRHIAVGFVAGMIVMVLVQMQWRETRRRRQGVLAASKR